MATASKQAGAQPSRAGSHWNQHLYLDLPPGFFPASDLSPHPAFSLPNSLLKQAKQIYDSAYPCRQLAMGHWTALCLSFPFGYYGYLC